MSKQIKTSDSQDFAKLLEQDTAEAPSAGDTVRGTVLSASKAEVRMDINGISTGVVRGEELYGEAEEYANLKPGDEVEATVVEEENENGELELSFKYAGQARAWANLKDSYKNKTVIKVKIVGANRGGLIANFGQISGFLPVSQLSSEKYPRVSGGDRGKILEKLKSFIGQDMDVMVANLDKDGREDKVIFSEKEVWSDKQKKTSDKYKVGAKIEGIITAIASFGVFVSFGENLEGLIHISELAWQRIDSPADLFKIGDKIKAEIISVDGSKIFLSAKKLIKDPWEGAAKKYKIGQVVKGVVIKVNPFGLFIKLDKDIHGLAHITQLGLAPGQKINSVFKVGDEQDFTVSSIEPRVHRLGLLIAKKAAEKGNAGDSGNTDKKTSSEAVLAKLDKKKEGKKEAGEKVKDGDKGNKETDKKENNKTKEHSSAS